MELQLSDDEQLFYETTERFLEDKTPVAELRARRDDPVGYEDGFWAEGVQLGWTSLLVSEDDGGGSVSWPTPSVKQRRQDRCSGPTSWPQR